MPAITRSRPRSINLYPFPNRTTSETNWYKKVIKNDKFILIVHGSPDDTTHVQAILDRTQPETLEHHLVSRNAPLMGVTSPQ